MSKDVIIIGASGQAKNISLLVEQVGGYQLLGFVDDDIEKAGKFIRNYKVLGNFKDVFASLSNINIIFAIGNSKVVEEMVRSLKSMNKNFEFPNLIHPTAQIDLNEVKMGEGNIINSNAVFMADVKIGNFNYFNRCCSVSHDVEMEDYCFVHSGVHLSGGLKIGKGVWFGVNSTIIQYLNISDDAFIGAGAVVLKDVEEKAVMVGNPAKVLRYLREHEKS